ncbi:MAG: glycerol-3-phosphate dehydrogenase [Alphaproteobacteria bacterium]|nr:glycerol-3-phosphate dehydrogenase [Alphaproteobacteria bacterium]
MTGPSERKIYDLAVVGGGINGCGIARDAAGRGLSVYLCEMNDLASGTSSCSTKLIHGGLRYLEHWQFRLVREALEEREVLWALAPHIIKPLRFVLPHHRGLRSAWSLRLGLLLYDHLGGRKLLPPATMLDLRRDTAGATLKPGAFLRGFEYSDCRVDDARLVVLTARDAAERGATVETRTTAVAAHPEDEFWSLLVEGPLPGLRRTVRAKALVNAGGPWVADVLCNRINTDAKLKARLVRGSHIVVRKLYDHDRAYLFQNADRRVVFAIPYEADFTLIGTTDLDFFGDPASAKATPDEIAYLCNASNEYLANPIRPTDVVWSYSGVRALCDGGASDPQAATRDYAFDFDALPGRPPLLSVLGGKITTYRRLAEAALEKLTPYLPTLARNTGWTAYSSLPGGDIPLDGPATLAADLCKRFPFLPRGLAQRLADAYGTRSHRILAGARRFEDLGRLFGADLTEAEVRYLVENEWAATAEDVVWRRSKLGLVLTSAQIAELDSYMKARDLGVPAQVLHGVSAPSETPSASGGS